VARLVRSIAWTLTALAGAASLAGCLPPPPGVFFERGHVEPARIAPERPLRAVAVAWDSLLPPLGAPDAACRLEACRAEPAAWLARCVEPRASASADAIVATLRERGRWHPETMAVLATLPPRAACDADAVVSLVAASVGARAAAQAPPACGLRAARVVPRVFEVDHSSIDTATLLSRDMPFFFVQYGIAVLTLGTATAMGDLLARVVVLDVELDDTVAARRVALTARGGAAVTFGTLGLMETRSRLPPALLPAALTEAFADLGARLRAIAEDGCRSGTR
jgi:hypothetical protein